MKAVLQKFCVCGNYRLRESLQLVYAPASCIPLTTFGFCRHRSCFCRNAKRYSGCWNVGAWSCCCDSKMIAGNALFECFRAAENVHPSLIGHRYFECSDNFRNGLCSARMGAELRDESSVFASDSVTWRVGVWLSQYSSSFPGSQALGEPPSKFALLAVSFFWLVSVIFLYYR